MAGHRRERLDLHLPLGWGDIPWDDMLPKLAVRDATVFIIELPPQFAAEAPMVAAKARRLIELIGTALLNEAGVAPWPAAPARHLFRRSR